KSQAPVPGPHPRRLRRRHGVRVHLVRALRRQARQAPGQPDALGGRAGQGLAHRPYPAAARGDAGRRRPRALADHHRHGRRARARARHRRYRLGRPLRAGRREGLAGKQLPLRQGHRGEVARHRRRSLHLYESPAQHRGARMNLKDGMSGMTPPEIVHELDKYIVGQGRAKRAVAIALRNRWRRLQVAEPLRQEITPKNILLIGPTGVGKTEIARRLARLADAPFIKVEATKFTEVGYVGRDVDSIVRDLVEISIKDTREAATKKVRRRAEDSAEERLLDVLLPSPPRTDASGADGAELQANIVGEEESATQQKFRKRPREGQLVDKEIHIEMTA